MKLAFTTLACPDWTLEQAVDAAQRYGYAGIELRLLDGGARLRLRRRQRPGLALDVAATVPADRQLPVFERLLTVRTTLHDSSRTASPPRAWIGQCPCRQRRRADSQCRRGARHSPTGLGRALFRAARSQKRHAMPMFVLPNRVEAR